MTARLHPGVVRHVWDHFVLGLRDGTAEARLSLYAIAWSPALGGGNVALLDLPDGSARAWADQPGLGEGMQARLRVIGSTAGSAEVPVASARFERAPGGLDGFSWRIEGDDGVLVARWGSVRPAIWAEGRAPAFWDREDIWACFVDASVASIELDGRLLPGAPWLADVWVPTLGRALWSAHVALAEVRVDPVHETMTP